MYCKETLEIVEGLPGGRAESFDSLTSLPIRVVGAFNQWRKPAATMKPGIPNNSRMQLIDTTDTWLVDTQNPDHESFELR